jgi:hypothetical protein
VIVGMLVSALYAIYALLIRPGVNISIKDVPPASAAPTDTGVWFVVGTSDSGPLTPQLIQGINDFIRIYGARQTYSYLYDALDVYFREGGRRAWVSRVVGPAATVATKTLLDASAGVSLNVAAIGPGVYAQQYKVGVVAGSAGGTFQIQITDLAGTVLEQSGDLTTQADAIAWSAYSQYVRITLGATALVPAVVAPAAFTGGADDRANATDTEWLAALSMFSKELGPGQVSMPGRTTDTAHTQLLSHAAANNRVAVLDAPDTATVSTLTAAATAARTNGRFGGIFAPWIKVPGVVQNTQRSVPPSAMNAGLMARNDVSLNPNVASAGARGVSSYAVDVTQTWTDAQRQTLNDAGVNVAIARAGTVRNYGFRSLANPASDPSWTGLQAARTVMAFFAQADTILEQFMFDDIDGQGKLLARVTGQLINLANEFYLADALFGATPGEAYAVVCDASNNTPLTIQNKELHAAVQLKVSEFAEAVYLDIVKIPVSQSIA